MTWTSPRSQPPSIEFCWILNPKKKRRHKCRRHTNQAGLGGVVLDLDAQRLQELQVLIADLEFGIAGERGDQGSLVSGFLAGLADADGGFEDQENVVAAFLDFGNDIGDLLGVGQRFVDRLAQLLHQLLQLLVHMAPCSHSYLIGCLRASQWLVTLLLARSYCNPED